jgi:MFS transporter, DHA3 family, macrolide efflux protein
METDLSLFKNKNFLFYWLPGWISSLGDGAFIIALTWMLVQTTGSSLIVGSYLFVLGVTKLGFIMLGGMVLTGFITGSFLIFSDVTRAILIIAFFGLGVHGAPPLWSFYVVGVLFGLVDSVNEPASISCRKLIVEETYYTQSMGFLTGLLEMAAALLTFSPPVVRSHGKATVPAKIEVI